MPLEPIGNNDDLTDYDSSIVPISEIPLYSWWDSTGNRVALYESPAEAAAFARVRYIDGFAVIVDNEDGTYSLSVQYEFFV